jgi:hypothetical protein
MARLNKTYHFIFLFDQGKDDLRNIRCVQDIAVKIEIFGKKGNIGARVTLNVL